MAMVIIMVIAVLFPNLHGSPDGLPAQVCINCTGFNNM